MLSRTSLALLSLVLTAHSLHAATHESPVRMPFTTTESGWEFRGTGLHEGWPDRRDLFVLYHPWSAAREGCFGTVSREVGIPAGWSGRSRLHFYITDDYSGSDAPLGKDNWLGQNKLVGHRFKQILADDEVIWEQDVADPSDIQQPMRFSVLLPEKIKPGMRVRLTFKLLDKVGTDWRLPQDYRHIGNTETIKESDEWKFMTHVYVGDVCLTPADVESLPSGQAPSVAACRAVHQQRWPLKPYGDPVAMPVALQWERWAEVTSQTCAIHCGVPLPAGMFTDTKRIALRDKSSKRLPVQVAPMNRWPDGSLRWVELDTVVQAGEQTRELMLDIVDVASQPPPCEQPVGVRSRNGNAITIQSGKLEAVVGADGGELLHRLVQGQKAVEGLSAELKIESKIYRPAIDAAKVIADGPLRTEVELSGQLVCGDERIGRCVFRLAAFAGQPYVRMTWRIFNDRKETLKVSRFQIVARCDLGPGVVSRWGDSDKTGDNHVSLRQLKEDRFEVRNGAGAVVDSGAAAPGWLAAVGREQTMMVMVRNFREQFPKALELAGDRVRISLFEASADEPYYLPTEGEAKHHEIWLGLWDRKLTATELEKTGRCFAHPPRLFSADYACSSGGFGYMARHDRERFPEFDAIVRGIYGDIPAKLFYVNGIRNWGDKPYGTNWCNGYYDVQQGLAGEYVMSGDPRWFDHLEACVRHIIDIDVCHASTAQPGWVGAIHDGHDGPNHTSSYPWNPTQRIKGTLAYWRLTGDRDARDAALGVADAALRENRCVGNCVSVRDHAGILYCLTAAFDETQDPKYLQAAQRVAHDAISRIDRRRGCYAEVHGNISYRGNVPWMCAQLSEPMYEYYRQSGDIEAAVAVVGLAESILTENRTRNVDGDVFGYSHNPHYGKNSAYHVLIAPAVLYAYELTGDEYYLTQGRAMYAQMIRERSLNDVRNCYWNAPTLLYYLTRYAKQAASTTQGEDRR